MKKTTCYISSILILVSASALQASVVLLGNYPNPGPPVPAGGYIIDEGGTESQSAAIVFTTPSSAFTVDSVTLRLSDYTFGESPQVGFFQSAGALPGTQLGGFLVNPAANTGFGADFVFTPSSTLTLLPSTQYWLTVAASAGEFQWRRATVSPVPTGLATSNGYRTSGDAGVTYDADTTRALFSVEASPVPEPATNAVIAVGLLGGFVFIRRMRAKKSK